MQQDILSILLDRYLTGDLTAVEREQLAALANDPANKLALEEFVEQVMVSGKYGEGHHQEIKQRLDAFIDNNILVKRPEPKHIVFYKMPWFRYSAAIMLIVAAIFSLISYTKTLNQASIARKPVSHPPIPPGGNKAVLTLADGSTIILDNSVKGSVAQQGSIKIMQLAPGHLAYATDHRVNTQETVGYNTISTPKGGQYQIVLTDGSHVWLNAASSLKFPAAFSDSVRNIEITGEVYLEVAKDIKKPFRVKVGRQNIEVLGTGFNVNAYEDENAVRTTLVEGSIKIMHDNESGLLQPGKQSVLEKNGSFSIIEADVNQETAWKNGLFQFSKADIKSVMRQLGRWYNVDILYSGKTPSMKFSGEIQRDLNLEDVMSILEDSGVNLKLEGKILKVLS